MVTTHDVVEPSANVALSMAVSLTCAVVPSALRTHVKLLKVTRSTSPVFENVSVHWGEPDASEAVLPDTVSSKLQRAPAPIRPGPPADHVMTRVSACEWS